MKTLLPPPSSSNSSDTGSELIAQNARGYINKTEEAIVDGHGRVVRRYTKNGIERKEPFIHKGGGNTKHYYVGHAVPDWSELTSLENVKAGGIPIHQNMQNKMGQDKKGTNYYIHTDAVTDITNFITAAREWLKKNRTNEKTKNYWKTFGVMSAFRHPYYPGNDYKQPPKPDKAPGYFSEHNTGYAIDLSSLTNPGGYLKRKQDDKFYDTLVSMAKTYNLYKSFPANNSRGISPEDWHFHWVQRGHRSYYALFGDHITEISKEST